VEEMYLNQLNKFGVKIKIVDFAHNPPVEFGNTFRGCFYLFDAISAEEDNVLYIDPDVYCIGKIPIEIFQDLRPGALLMQFPDDKNINGVTPIAARAIHSALGSDRTIVDHKHYGGEAIYIPGGLRRNIIVDIENIWERNVSAALRGEPFLPTEEHVMSLIFSNYEVINLNLIILRIWTTVKYNRVEGGTLKSAGICLWHLPAEKSYGFQSAYDLILKDMLYSDISEANQLFSERRMFHINNRIQKLLFRIKKLVG
jgi:hypothetical protein